MNKFICNICGYEYETELEEIPDDYFCPICGASKVDFTRI
jgi:rubredoxin